MHPVFSYLNLIDYPITEFLNQFVQKSHFLDLLNAGLEGESLLKGGVVVAFVWWAWFRPSGEQEKSRSFLISGIVAGTVAIAIARLLALSLPYRQRPRFTPELHFCLPFGSDQYTLLHWSSFPSDHAALFFALATAVYLVSRRAGWLCYGYVAFFICLPRIYCGTHFFSDLLVGGLIGITSCLLVSGQEIRNRLARLPLHWMRQRPSQFYCFAYLATVLMATNFDLIRKAGSVVLHSLHVLH